MLNMCPPQADLVKIAVSTCHKMFFTVFILIFQHQKHFRSHMHSVSKCSKTHIIIVSLMMYPGCEKEAGSSMWIYVLLGNLLRGIGETPIQPLGITYIDDHAIEENAALYIGKINNDYFFLIDFSPEETKSF